METGYGEGTASGGNNRRAQRNGAGGCHRSIAPVPGRGVAGDRPRRFSVGAPVRVRALCLRGVLCAGKCAPPLPGTIKFDQNPSKEGEVTSGTIAKLKINGKEAAVIGSMVTTCNDMGAKDNSTILAPGASMPMPAIANPDTPPEEEKETRHPDFTTVQWQKTKAKEQEVVELTASVKDIADGNGVTFQVWRKGEEPEGGIPQAVTSKRIEGGEAKAEFSYKLPGGGAIPEEDPEFFFTAHSAWCPYKKSGNLTVELAKLENPVWVDAEGNETGKGLVGQALTLTVESRDLADGGQVLFRVFPEGADPEHDKAVAAIQGTNKGGKAEAAWTYEYKHDPEKPLTEKPKFFFTASGCCRGAKSGTVEIAAVLRVYVYLRDNSPLKDMECVIDTEDGVEFQATTDEAGFAEKQDCVPNEYTIHFTGSDFTQVLFLNEPNKIVLKDTPRKPSL